MWLKRTTPLNIVIGGAAGALPPLIGWTAVTGSVAVEPVVLFLIIFFWTPPHFWALSLYRTEDYARAGVPMLPVVAGARETRRQILVYTLILAPLGVAPWLLGYAGPAYGIARRGDRRDHDRAGVSDSRRATKRPHREQTNVRASRFSTCSCCLPCCWSIACRRDSWPAVRAFRGMTTSNAMNDAMNEEPPPTGIKLTEEQQRARRARSIAIAVSLGALGAIVLHRDAGKGSRRADQPADVTRR